MSSILRITRSRKITLSHRCSVCGYTVIHFCTVDTLVCTSYEFSQAKATAHAEEVANSQIDALIADIASCWENPHPLGKLCPSSIRNPWEDIEECVVDHKTNAATRISGLTEVCPCCGNLEPWQKTVYSMALKEAKAESFPTVIENTDRAELYSLLHLQTMLEENEAVRRDPRRLEAAREENSRLLAERSNVQKELRDDSIEQNISSLNEQKARLAGDKKATGFLALKAKKEIGAQIDEIDQQIEKLKKQDKKKKDELNRTLRRVDFELERYAVLFASDDVKVEHIWNTSSKVLRLYADQPVNGKSSL